MKIIRALVALLTVSLVATQAEEKSIPLRLVQTIPLPNIEGRVDHLAVDLKGQRLFVAALGNNTLEIIDLHMGKRIHSITGLREPQGVIFIPELNKIFVTNGESGACDIFDGDSFKLAGRINFSGDADNIRYDAVTKYIYVGYGDGTLGIINTTNGKHIGDIKLEGHPESFQLEKNGRRIFVNVPTANHIAVVDREKRVVVSKWPLTDIQANFPMALDETHHRLFVGSRKPAKFIIFNTESGKLIADLESVGDPDDIFYDSLYKRIYVSGGGGFINVFEQSDVNHYKMVAKILTVSGARTSLFVPELNHLYLAVPRHADQRAEVRIYEIQP
jgi:DNA-binding beta-propeller fold protein YncE